MRPRLKTVFIALGFLASAAIGVAGGLIFISLLDMPDIIDLTRYAPSPGTKLYDNSEPPELIAQIAIEQRTFVPLSRIPLTLLDAIVAIEDERFHSHWGLDLWGIGRAAAVNFMKGRVVEGGSTITQQLARTLFLTQERTLERKIKEALLAIQIERKYKKEEILEMYLNQVYFGNGAYGAEQAARTYFGKHVEELTLPECAMLAGVVRAPSNYNPYRDPEKAASRRNLVLQKMADNGFAERGEVEEAQSSPVSLRKTEETNAPYFAAFVQDYISEKYGTEAVYRGGLSVLTTLNLRIQTIAQRALEGGLRAAADLIRARTGRTDTATSMHLQGALVALDPRTGAVLAMIGGRSFKENQFNRATQALRQPGSAFKPIIYATALANGFTPADLINDAPQQYPGKDGKSWQPSNFERKFFGLTSIRRALALSRNVVTVKLLDQIGTATVLSLARKFGLHDPSHPLRPDLTLALGTSEVNLLDIVSAFSVFPSGGIKTAPYAIRLVKDSHGTILEQNKPEYNQVISPQIAFLMVSMMRDTVDYGTARVVRRLGFTRPAGGKTGSTNDFTDAWFIGFTPTLACGIWIGYDDRRTLGKNVTGGIIAAPIWASFMAEALENQPVEQFETPSGVVTATIDPTTGLLATKLCPQARTEYFVEGTAPTRQCAGHDASTHFGQEDLKRIEEIEAETAGLDLSSTPSGAPQALPEDVPGQEGGF